MTLSKEELSGLVKRVRGLKGPDREVDRLIFDTLLGGLFWPENRDFFTRNHAWTAVPREFTESVDAALALVERVQPGWSYELTKTKHCVAEMWLADENGFVGGNYPHVKPVEAATLPLAIILALLLSLQSQEPK